MIEISKELINALRRLVISGEAPAKDLKALAGEKLGLWYKPNNDEDEEVCFMSFTLYNIIGSINHWELRVATILACEKVVRERWLHISACWLKELVNLKDMKKLCNLIGIAGDASIALNEIVQALPGDLPNDSKAIQVEKFLFGISDHLILRPKIFTAISRTGHLIEGGLVAPAMVLRNVDFSNPSKNWISGRLLHLPKEARLTAKLRKNFSSPILIGNWKPPEHLPAKPCKAVVSWIVGSPWLFLLTQLVLVKERWSKETRLTRSEVPLDNQLILQPKEKDEFLCPKEIIVKIKLIDSGYEVECGSLAELLMRVLDNLGVHIFTSINISELNALLSPLIQELLIKNVWAFDYGNNNGCNYQINIHFAANFALDNVFSNLGQEVAEAISKTCENWGKEKLQLMLQQISTLD